MSWIADAHRDWHVVYGQIVCPLDCGIGDDPEYDPDDVYEEVPPVEVPELFFF